MDNERRFDSMDTTVLICLTIISTSASCSAAAGCIAYHKRRNPNEGVLLGLLLGPIGILIECRLSYVQRPMVDENAWNSFRSMTVYQQNTSDSKHHHSSTMD
jgi:hypothetical protein